VARGDALDLPGQPDELHDDNVRGAGLGNQLVRGTLTQLSGFGTTERGAGGPKRLIDLRLDTREPPRPIVVYVGLEKSPPTAAINDPALSLFANLSWGAGSGFVRERVPLRFRGLARGVVAHYLSLDLIPQLPGTYVASAFAAFGFLSHGVLNVEQQTIAALGTADFVVADWATSMKAQADLPAPAILPWVFLDATGAAIASTATGGQMPLGFEWPIPRQAAFVRITNPDAVARDVLVEWRGPIG
jgi:hypothetical protein